MKPYRELVKEYPELGDILAEMQLEIEELQNLQPYPREPEREITTETRYIPIDPKQYQSRLAKLENRVLSLENYFIQKAVVTPKRGKEPIKAPYKGITIEATD